uniref:Uncharacterized protein n=1 Tax=Tetranychus urticae TaxID=32264 RepID=T1K3S9_TETUR
MVLADKYFSTTGGFFSYGCGNIHVVAEFHMFVDANSMVTRRIQVDFKFEFIERVSGLEAMLDSCPLHGTPVATGSHTTEGTVV